MVSLATPASRWRRFAQRATWRGLGRLALIVLGLLAVSALVSTVGPSSVGTALAAAAIWLPLALALEGLRIGTEVATTAFLLRPDAGRVGTAQLVRAGLIGYSLTIAAPAGRAAAEAVRTAIFAPAVGVGRAASVAATNQALNLFGNGVFLLLCAAGAAFWLGLSWLTGILLAGGVLMAALGFIFHCVVRGPRLARWLVRFPRLARHIPAFHEAARSAPFVPRAAFFATLSGRALQALQIGLLAHAVGVGLTGRSVMLGQGANLMSSLVGDWIPGQLGATDGALSLTAQHWGATPALALSVAVLVHCVQLFWVATGALVSAAWGPRVATDDGPPMKTGWPFQPQMDTEEHR